MFDPTSAAAACSRPARSPRSARALLCGRSAPPPPPSATPSLARPPNGSAASAPTATASCARRAPKRPFSSPLDKEKRRGTFPCAGCGLPLFSSSTKFDSGTGWPSFYAALPNAIRTRRDGALGMWRIEEHCRRCGGHLGHVFDDGPAPDRQAPLHQRTGADASAPPSRSTT